jgi:WD40 repeat protein
LVLTGCVALGDAINPPEGPSPQLHWLAGGHAFGAAAVQFLADGQLLSAGAGLKRWDVSARRLKRTLSTPRIGEDLIALGPGEAWVATVSWHPDRALILRELSEGRELQRLPLVDTNMPPLSLSASPEGEWLLGAAADGRIFRWHVPSGEALPPLQIQVLRPQGPSGWWGTLVTSNEFVAWDFQGVFRARLEPPELLWERTVEAYSGPVLSADRRWVAFVETNRVLVLDARTGETRREILTDGAAPYHLVFTADAARLVGTQRDLPVSVWRTADGALEFTLPGLAESVTALAISPDGRTLAAAHQRGISLWDLEDRRGPEELTALPSIVYSLAVSTNGLVAVGTGLGHMALFDLASGERRVAWKPGSNSRALALAPSGEWLVTEGAGATLSVHRLPKGTLERSVPIPRSQLERLELSAGGDRLAAQPQQGAPFVIRTADWIIERSFELARNDWLRALRLSPDGRRLAGVLSDRSVRVWDVENSEVVATLAPEYSGLPEWHDEGTRLWLVGSAGRVTRWNIVTGELEYDQTLALDGANLVRALWLPDRSGVLLSLGDVGLELWRLDRPERVVRYTREVGRACFAMVLAPGNDRVILGRYDATVAVAGLPFFLGARPGGPGEIVVTARGPTGPLHWETRGESGAWELVPDHSGPELTLSATDRQRWVRAGLAESSR